MNQGVVVDDFGHRMDQGDDALGCDVAGGRLAAEDDGTRDHVITLSRTQAIVAGDDPQYIEQLTLVFVNSFDLYVKQGLGIERHAVAVEQICGQGLFISLFHRFETMLECFIVGPMGQCRELGQVVLPGLSQGLRKQGRKTEIGFIEPASWRDPIGDIEDLARIEGIEFGKGRGLEQLGM